MNPTYDFQGQVALVTGASSGIGLTTAEAFAQAGAAVMLADINDLVAGGSFRVADPPFRHGGAVVGHESPRTTKPQFS